MNEKWELDYEKSNKLVIRRQRDGWKITFAKMDYGIERDFWVKSLNGGSWKNTIEATEFLLECLSGDYYLD